MIGFANGEKLLTESDLQPQWNMFSGTKDLSSFYFKNGSSIEKKSNFSSNPNIGLVQTDMIAHLWGATPSQGMLFNRDNPYFNKGYYTLSLVARHNDTSTPNLTFPLQFFSDYTDAHTKLSIVTFNITGTFQKYSGTFYIDTAGNYSNWRLGNADNVQYPEGSIYITDIKLEPGTVATTWMPAISDLALKSDLGGQSTSTAH